MNASDLKKSPFENLAERMREEIDGLEKSLDKTAYRIDELENRIAEIEDELSDEQDFSRDIQEALKSLIQEAKEITGNSALNRDDFSRLNLIDAIRNAEKLIWGKQ